MITVFILTNNHDSQQTLQLKQAFEANGALVSIGDSLYNLDEPKNIIIVDLDSLDIRDTEEFKDKLSNLATRILFICTTSFQRLFYYNEFETYTSVDNLLQREFFAFPALPNT